MLTDDYRGYRVAVLRGTQREKIDVWNQIVGFKPDVCVDVGANYGEFSVSAAALGARQMIAIEANPLLIPCLRATLGQYQATAVIHAAIADRDGEDTDFFFNARETGSASIAAASPSSGPNRYGTDVSSAKVPTRRLDTLVPELLGAQPRSLLLKVDVEGFEEAVLAGVGGLISQASWWRAIIEFNPSALRNSGSDPARVWEKLREFPGFVIDGTAVNEQKLARLEARLPLVTPGECDVLIGFGSPPP